MVPPYYSYYRRRHFEKPLFIGTLLAVCLACWMASFFMEKQPIHRYGTSSVRICRGK